MRSLPSAIALWFMCLATLLLAAAERDERVRIDKPLIGWWDFDEASGDVCRDVSGNGRDASPQKGSYTRVAGISGNAIEFTGQHMLRVPGKFEWGKLKGLSFSAWVMPTELGTYKEIFRKEDGEDRVLFSFQDNGAHLSLGLNIGGYVECDAPIDAAKVMDGQWHHAAATFDGRFMRVYLDGKEIGSLERPGEIRAGGDAPACIGSMNDSECFQGTMDDLRIYGEALTAEEIGRLFGGGREAMKRFAAVAERDLQAVSGDAKTFAQVVVRCRKHVLENGRQLAPGLAAKVRAAYAKECEEFASVTGASLGQYLVSARNEYHLRQAERLVELMLEYRPLTPQQRKKQTAEDAGKWQEAEGIAAKFERLKGQGDGAKSVPEWVEVMLEAGRRVQLRPYVAEAVAPYVKPSTPQTRNLSAAEAERTLQRDWLHQVGGNPSPEAIRREIVWAKHLAGRIAAEFSGRVDVSGKLARLAELEKRAAALTKADASLYFEVRRLKREIAFANPLVDFDKVLFVDMPYPQGSEWQHETRHRLGYMAVPGARLLVLEGLSPGGKLRQLMPQPPLHGAFWRPDLSWDGKKVLFCFKPHNEKSFHIYEMSVDGGEPVQLTDGPYDDLDPAYLPDGHILFSTTRGHTYVRCMPPTNAYVLARADADGRNIYLVSQNNEPDYLPSVMHDGRVVYTRWEYTDKPLWRAQKLWAMNPDGTQVTTLWGNQSVWPDVAKDARGIPGSRRVMFTGSAHHNWFAGSVGIIDPDRGMNFPDGLTKVTTDVAWPETGNGPVDPAESAAYHRSGDYPAYYSPYPLGEKDFLVSAQRGGKFMLYLMDVDGNRELIYEGVHNIFHAMPVKARPRPPVMADRVAWPTRDERLAPKDGVIFSNDVYEGAPAELKGKAKYLRVWHIDPKTYTYWNKRPYISTGPVVSIVQSEGVKRLLGTVPIEKDGSVSFHAPPGKALHFQLLDENQRALQTMRSFVGVMPGEYRGCLGCHAGHTRTPPPAGSSLATLREPSTITAPPWGQDTVSYPRYVQPVLNRYCGKCHQGDGEGRKALDLTDRPGFLGFSEPYMLLTGQPTWGQPYKVPAKAPPGFGFADIIMVEGFGQTDPAAYATPKPMTRLSYRSRLIEIASNGKHYDTRVDEMSLQRLIAWVDAMAPYRGDSEVREIDDPVFQGVDWLSVRPRIKTAPVIVRPGPVD